ncbi:MAG: hypothetical protein KAH72_10610 [Flavobacteriaceae bacterium]|nr:hypothetical protein [Flavobacteriaceae bacterium]
MQEEDNTKPKNRSLDLLISFNIILAIISGILVEFNLNAHNLLSTLAYMFLLLPLAFITHIVAFFNSIMIKSKKGIVFFLLSIITVSIIFYPAINDISEGGLSSDGYINYSSFKCKDTNITSHVPIHIYSYKSGRGGGIMDQITPYFSTTLDMLDKIREDISTTTHTVYPIGTTLNIQRLYSHCSFGNGCYDDFLVKSEDGVFFWLSASDISSDTCSFKYDYSINNQDLNATNGTEVNIKAEHVSSAPINRYNSKNDYDKIISNFKNYTIHDPKKSTLIIHIPKYNYKMKYIYKYILHSIERYISKEVAYNIEMKFSQNDLFLVEYKLLAKHAKRKYFYPYNCKEFIKTPYGCFNNFDSWLKNPYQQNTIIYDALITEENIMQITQDTPYILVLNIQYQDYDHIIRVHNFLKKLQNNIGNIPIYKPDITMQHHFKNGGFYIIDTNTSIKEFGSFYLEEFVKKAEKYFSKQSDKNNTKPF